MNICVFSLSEFQVERQKLQNKPYKCPGRKCGTDCKTFFFIFSHAFFFLFFFGSIFELRSSSMRKTEITIHAAFKETFLFYVSVLFSLPALHEVFVFDQFLVFLLKTKNGLEKVLACYSSSRRLKPTLNLLTPGY